MWPNTSNFYNIPTYLFEDIDGPEIIVQLILYGAIPKFGVTFQVLIAPRKLI